MTEEELAKEQSNIKEGSRVKTLKMISVAGDPVRKFRDGVVKKITGDMISVDFGSGNLIECDRKNLRLNSRVISSNRVVANAVACRAVVRNAFQNPRFVQRLKEELQNLPNEMKEALKRQKEHFVYWYKSDLVEVIELKIRRIDDAISSGDGDENEVKALKEMRPKFEKYLSEAKAVITKVNTL